MFRDPGQSPDKIITTKEIKQMAECTHDCSTCGENCSSRNEPQDLTEKLNQYSSVKKVIGVVSGKGGVGKSTVTSWL